MARIVRFDLTMKDGYKVEREIEELRDHFDLATVVGYYHDGTLSRWLKRNKYAEEAAAIEELTDEDNLARELCLILGVDTPKTGGVDSDEIRDRAVRLARLKDYTDDPALLEMAENAAFTQEEMDALLEEGEAEIILCNGRFLIPLNVRGTSYYGVGRAVAVIGSDVPVDFAKRHITFEGVEFDEAYQRLVGGTKTAAAPTRSSSAAQEELARAREYCEQGDARCVPILERLAEDGNTEAMSVLAFYWYDNKNKGNDKNKAVFWAEKAASQGNSFAMLMMGHHCRGAGRLDEARSYYKKTVECGDADEQGDALNSLGEMYLSGQFGDGQQRRAIEYFMQSSECGSADGTLNLARCFDQGGVTEDLGKAFTYYLKTVELADDEIDTDTAGEALNRLGVIYSRGALGKADVAMAARYYEQAAVMGDACGAYNLANAYENGEGVPKDEKKAVEYYRQAAEAGLAEGMKGLADCYAFATGVMKDNDKAYEFYLQAAEAGIPYAMLRTGDLLADSERYDEAHEWYVKTTKTDDKAMKGWAFDRLGNLYLNNNFGENREPTAVNYFQKSAAEKCTGGMNMLAYCYRYGIGTKENRDRAKAYLREAASLGDEESRTELKEMEEEDKKGIWGLFS